MNENERRNFSLVYNEDSSAVAARMADGKVLMLAGTVDDLQAAGLVAADTESIPCPQDGDAPPIASMVATEDGAPPHALTRASGAGGAPVEAAPDGGPADNAVGEPSRAARGQGGLGSGLGALAATAVGGLGRAARSAVAMRQRRRAEGAAVALSSATQEVEACTERLAKGGAVAGLLPRAQEAMRILREQGRVLETLQDRYGVTPAGGSAVAERGVMAARGLASELDSVGGNADRSDREREQARELAEMCREMTRALMELVRKLLGRAPAGRRSTQPGPGR